MCTPQKALNDDRMIGIDADIKETLIKAGKRDLAASKSWPCLGFKSSLFRPLMLNLPLLKFRTVLADKQNG